MRSNSSPECERPASGEASSRSCAIAVTATPTPTTRRNGSPGAVLTPHHLSRRFARYSSGSVRGRRVRAERHEVQCLEIGDLDRPALGDELLVERMLVVRLVR